MPENRNLIKTRTRGTNATLTVNCSHGSAGTKHTIFLKLTGEIESPHDTEADQVLMALGGEIHECGRAVNSFTAAQNLYSIMTGDTDLSTLRYNNMKGWYDQNTCSSCPSHAYRLTHYYSLQHLAETFHADKSTLRTLYKWIVRNNTNRKIINDNVSKNILKKINDQILFPQINGLYLSETYIESAEKILGQNPKNIVETRLNGITVEWMAELSSQVHSSAAVYARNNNENLHASLTKARNAPPTLVAKYLNAGIVTHFYTYSRVNASPSDILAIYRASNGTKTLAELLQEGYTIPQALREYGH